MRKVLGVPFSKLLFFGSLSFIAGIGLSPYFSGIFLFAFLAIPFFENKKVAFLLALLFTAGVFYYELRIDRDFLLPEFEGEAVEFTGRVTDGESGFLEVVDFRGRSLSEKVAVYPEADIHYGEVMKIRGTPDLPDGEFAEFYQSRGVSVLFFDPDLEVVGESGGWRLNLFKAREFLAGKVRSGLDPPASEVYEALLLGRRSRITREVSEKFSKAGVGHLLAISGTHIVIISGVLVSLLSALGLAYKKLLAFLILIGYVAFIGAPPSAVRAGLMGGMVFLAKATYRKPASVRGLSFIAAGMLVMDPSLLHGDVGFRLSFGAAAGILLFSDRIKSFLARIRKPFPGKGEMANILAVTLSAQIFVLPLIFLHFDYFPFLAPVSNLVLAPLLPVVIILGWLSLILSIAISPPAAFLVSGLVMDWVLLIVELFYGFYGLW